jgi:hypothetical protein
VQSTLLQALRDVNTHVKGSGLFGLPVFRDERAAYTDLTPFILARAVSVGVPSNKSPYQTVVETVYTPVRMAIDAAKKSGGVELPEQTMTSAVVNAVGRGVDVKWATDALTQVIRANPRELAAMPPAQIAEHLERVYRTAGQGQR